MRVNLLLATLLVYQAIPNSAQNLFVSQDYGDFFEWFHERSQVDQLYGDRTTLYIFSEKANIRKAPSSKAEIITQLPIGHAIINIAYGNRALPTAEINGYGDFWYHVKGKDVHGKPFIGYVWGANIAKGWREADITGDNYPEFIMLGVSSQTRKKPTDIKAEVCVLQNNRVVSRAIVPGLCVFEDCDASAMLRIMRSQVIPGLTIVETSAMTIGCLTGVDKAFFYWNGSGLERVYQAEYSTQTELYRKKFVVAPAGKPANNVQVCEYGGEDKSYNPIWNCKTVPVSNASDTKPIAAAK
ncbi:MAG: SH3 domain-containing protein [Saprospiraceae bacterium]